MIAKVLKTFFFVLVALHYNLSLSFADNNLAPGLAPEIEALKAGKIFIERVSENLDDNDCADFITIQPQLNNPGRLVTPIDPAQEADARKYGYKIVVPKGGCGERLPEYVVFSKPLTEAEKAGKVIAWVDQKNPQCIKTDLISRSPGDQKEAVRKKIINEQTPACTIATAAAAFGEYWLGNVIIKIRGGVYTERKGFALYPGTIITNVYDETVVVKAEYSVSEGTPDGENQWRQVDVEKNIWALRWDKHLDGGGSSGLGLMLTLDGKGVPQPAHFDVSSRPPDVEAVYGKDYMRGFMEWEAPVSMWLNMTHSLAGLTNLVPTWRTVYNCTASDPRLKDRNPAECKPEEYYTKKTMVDAYEQAFIPYCSQVIDKPWSEIKAALLPNSPTAAKLAANPKCLLLKLPKGKTPETADLKSKDEVSVEIYNNPTWDASMVIAGVVVRGIKFENMPLKFPGLPSEKFDSRYPYLVRVDGIEQSNSIMNIGGSFAEKNIVEDSFFHDTSYFMYLMGVARNNIVRNNYFYQGGGKSFHTADSSATAETYKPVKPWDISHEGWNQWYLNVTFAGNHYDPEGHNGGTGFDVSGSYAWNIENNYFGYGGGQEVYNVTEDVKYLNWHQNWIEDHASVPIWFETTAVQNVRITDNQILRSRGRGSSWPLSIQHVAKFSGAVLKDAYKDVVIENNLIAGTKDYAPGGITLQLGDNFKLSHNTITTGGHIAVLLTGEFKQFTKPQKAEFSDNVVSDITSRLLQINGNPAEGSPGWLQIKNISTDYTQLPWDSSQYDPEVTVRRNNYIDYCFNAATNEKIRSWCTKEGLSQKPVFKDVVHGDARITNLNESDRLVCSDTNRYTHIGFNHWDELCDPKPPLQKMDSPYAGLTLFELMALPQKAKAELDSDQCKSDPLKKESGLCGCGVADTDSDADAQPDCRDACPQDPAKQDPGICGCGVSDVDSDEDGTLDCKDECPADKNKTQKGVCGCGIADADTDGDKKFDCEDGCMNDPKKMAPGECGCGKPETDADEDGVADCVDACIASNEVCDGVDNDCDGETDNNLKDDEAPCETDKPGVCSTGHKMCSGGVVLCISQTKAVPELCDGLDNDCDGKVDEDQPSIENCNDGIDNNCNGKIDIQDEACQTKSAVVPSNPATSTDTIEIVAPIEPTVLFDEQGNPLAGATLMPASLPDDMAPPIDLTPPLMPETSPQKNPQISVSEEQGAAAQVAVDEESTSEDEPHGLKATGWGCSLQMEP